LASTITRPRASRFLPQSEGVEGPYLLTPRLALRIAVLGVVVLVVFAALVLRLWALQVLNGTQYLRTAQNNQIRTVRLQAKRGAILDRDSRALVTNVATTAIEIWPADLPKVYRQRYRELERISRIARVPLYEIAAALKARRDENDMLTPVTVRSDASQAQIAYLAEHRAEFAGVETTASFVRHYPYQSLAAQLLGYVGEISPEQLKRLRSQGYQAGDEVGQTGVEAAYDSWLRGKPGTAQLRVDARGRPRSALTLEEASQPGKVLRLTIDLNLQKAAERALRFGIRLAQSDGHWAARGGAIVALDPNDGSILAMASAPTYKPSVFAGKVTNKELEAQGLTPATAEARNTPALNRAIAGLYPPGSTFKPVTAIAALEEHLVEPFAYLSCTGSYTSPADRSHQPFKNWDPYVNQAMNMPTALAESCDTYFYQLGEKFYEMPADRGPRLQRWAAQLGFGQKSGLDIGGEQAGLLPTPKWRQRTYTKKSDPCCWQVDRLWKPGDSIQLAIGQKDLLVTPLQMARLYALIANNGKLVTPHLLLDVENTNHTRVPMAALAAPRQTNVDPNALVVVRQGLYDATHLPFGTTYGVFHDFPIPIAGKTGTAEKQVTLPGYVGNQDQSWWCGFGPYDDPKIVVCALIENGGHGGTAAAPAALRVFEQFFHRKAQNAIASGKTD
jgi:penicillin-binding protein 2